MDYTSLRLRDPWRALLTAAVILGGTLVFWQIRSASEGRFFYTLDDPYIHLALSEEIARGGYGINSGEFAAPSSSAIFPFLLAPFAQTSFHVYWPLALNLGTLIWTAMLLWTLFGELGLCDSTDLRAYSSIVILVLIYGFNLLGLVFTGMEHSLHVLLTLAILLGVVRVLHDRPLAPWLVPALILVPLVRFEGAAVALAASLVLFYLGHRKHALVAVGGVLVGLAAFSAFLTSLGLPLLPSSVLIKSSIAGRLLGGGAISGGGRSNPFLHPGGMLILFVLALMMLAGLLWRHRLTHANQLLLAFSGAVLSAHALVGTYGWFERYEVYAVVFGLVSIVCLLARPIKELVASHGLVILLALTLPAAAFAARPYLAALYLVPQAASNIYEQQYQMHRIATDFHKGPVAVNDLGWVAFQNSEYVLDLFGLGSEAARRARLDGLAPGELSALVRGREVGLAMIYGSWFAEAIPPEWIQVARLHLAHRRITAAVETVDFYVTGLGSRDSVLQSLHRYSEDLPTGVTLEFLGR